MRWASSRPKSHPWWGGVWFACFVLGWVAKLVIDGQNIGSTGTGWGNLGLTLAALAVGALFGAIGLAMLPFRVSRPAGSLLAAGGGGFAFGIVFGLLTLLP